MTSRPALRRHLLLSAALAAVVVALPATAASSAVPTLAHGASTGAPLGVTGPVGASAQTAEPATSRIASALLASSSLTAAPLSTTTDDAVGSTTWTVEPATADGPDGRVSHRVDAEPGQTVADHVAVTNFSARPATFELYASDGLVTADGQFDLLPAGTTPTDSGSWVALGEGGVPAAEGTAPMLVDVGPESTVTVPFTLTVPTDATPGDHPAGIVAALVPAAGEQQVTFDARVGVRLHLRVAGDVVPTLAVTDLQATYSPSWNPFTAGSVEVGYTVTNQGNVRLGAGTAVDASGPFGWGETTVEGAAQRELLPGQSATSTVVLDGTWPLGRMSGDVTVVPVVVGDDVVEVEVSAVSAGWSAWAVPWAQLALLTLAVAVVLLARRARRRREAATQRRIDAAVAALERETVDA